MVRTITFFAAGVFSIFEGLAEEQNKSTRVVRQAAENLRNWLSDASNPERPLSIKPRPALPAHKVANFYFCTQDPDCDRTRDILRTVIPAGLENTVAFLPTLKSLGKVGQYVEILNRWQKTLEKEHSEVEHIIVISDPRACGLLARAVCDSREIVANSHLYDFGNFHQGMPVGGYHFNYDANRFQILT